MKTTHQIMGLLYKECLVSLSSFLLLLSNFSGKAHNVIPENDVSTLENTLRTAIQQRSVAINEIQKDKILIDSLKYQVNDLQELVSILDSKLDSLKRPVTPWPLPLLSADSTVFLIEGINGYKVPPILQDHYDFVCLVSDIKHKIDQTLNDKMDALKFANGAPQDQRQGIIAAYLHEDLTILNSLISKLLEYNPDNVTPEQIEFINNLILTYNSFKIYFQ